MADDLVKRINSAIDVLQAVADGAAAFDKSGAPPVMGLLTEAIASLATKDAEIANLRADLKVKEIALDEAMAQGERQRAEIEGLREALEYAKRHIHTCVDLPTMVCYVCQHIDRALSQSHADLLARREAERKVIEAAMAWQEAIATEGIAADESVSLCDAMDALAALAEQEAKGDDRG